MNVESQAFGPVSRAAWRPQSANLSFEFFPPKTEKMEAVLWEAVQKLVDLNPKFVSVTYGAGGSTRDRTHKMVKKLVQETNIEIGAHLTCVGATQEMLNEIIDTYWNEGVRHIVALRGDPVEGVGQAYHPTPNGYPFASDLVQGIKKRRDFKISVAAYPERHPESKSWDDELDNIKRKVEAGADQAITQFFYDTDCFYRFKDRLEKANIDLPVIPGIMPIANFTSLKRMAGTCGTSIPDWMTRLLDGLEDDPKTLELVSTSIITELSADLIENGCQDIHIYTLNKAAFACALARVLQS